MNLQLQGMIREFMAELVETTPKDFMEIKLMLLANSAKNRRVYDFMVAVFLVCEERRLFLIEMK